MRKHLVNEALHLLYKMFYKLNLPFHLALTLFDHTLVPIYTYSCEVLGYKDIALIERVHCSFLRKMFKLRKGTSFYMLYGELGRYPLTLNIKYKLIGS